jgi:hypothetical protein
MPNLADITVTNGVPTAGTGTVSTLDNNKTWDAQVDAAASIDEIKAILAAVGA